MSQAAPYAPAGPDQPAQRPRRTRLLLVPAGIVLLLSLLGLYLFGEGLDPLGREAVTDGDGRATFADLSAGRLSIKPDRAPPQDATLLPGANTVELPRGRYPGRLDDKGRLKLPAAFKEFFDGLPEKKLVK